ncbi:unnamed protein product [Paramecium primaurelia]|uniref:Uncharacterized protein n=1 Tax=Paramecium primaurelia TaxID=5886 RepID=A0A8S1JTF5_PARPR|nr:unnamed protein product [Paramecium primaurelia]
MSLVYMLKLTSPILYSEQLSLNESHSDEKSIINTLLTIEGFNLSQQLNLFFNNSIIYPLQIYNQALTSALNNNTLQQTLNLAFIVYSNFTLLKNLANQVFNLSKVNIISYTKNFSYLITCE